jgi:hypothetical protein
VGTKIEGKWLEFRVDAQPPNSPAYGCSVDCSTAQSSEPLGAGNDSPYFYTSDACTYLEVLQGYAAGIAYYDVYDNGAKIFTTSVGQVSGASTTDPAVAILDPNYGRGYRRLPAGFHSIEIRANWINPAYGNAAGWLRITTTPCGLKCLKLGEWCIPGAPKPKRCCVAGRLFCRLKAGNDPSGPKQCLPCVPRAKRCTVRSDCCGGRRCLRNAAGVKKCF